MVKSEISEIKTLTLDIGSVAAEGRIITVEAGGRTWSDVFVAPNSPTVTLYDATGTENSATITGMTYCTVSKKGTTATTMGFTVAAAAAKRKIKVVLKDSSGNSFDLVNDGSIICFVHGKYTSAFGAFELSHVCFVFMV